MVCRLVMVVGSFSSVFFSDRFSIWICSWVCVLISFVWVLKVMWLKWWCLVFLFLMVVFCDWWD